MNRFAVFIASLAAIFLLPLHNSESDHRGCSRRCKNMESQIPALHAGVPTPLRGRMPYGLRRSSPRPRTTTIWQGETLAGLVLTSELGPRLLPSHHALKQRASLFPAPLLRPSQPYPPGCRAQRARSPSCSAHRFAPGHRGFSHPVPTHRGYLPTPFPRLAGVCQSNSSFKESQRRQQGKKNLLYLKMLSEMI